MVPWGEAFHGAPPTQRQDRISLFLFRVTQSIPHVFIVQIASHLTLVYVTMEKKSVAAFVNL